MPLYSLVLDLVALAVLALCAAYYAQRGFIAGVFSFFGTLIAILGAGLAAYHLAPAIFNSFFRPGIEERIAATIAEQGIYDIKQLLAEIMGFVPGSIMDSIVSNMDTSMDFAAPNIAQLVVDQVVAPMVMPIISVALFFVLFSLLRILVGVVRSIAVGINKMPAMNTVNSALGAVAGVFIGALYVYLGFCVIWAYDSLNPQNPLGDQYFSRSFLFRLLSVFNFFTKL